MKLHKRTEWKKFATKGAAKELYELIKSVSVSTQRMRTQLKPMQDTELEHIQKQAKEVLAKFTPTDKAKNYWLAKNLTKISDLKNDDNKKTLQEIKKIIDEEIIVLTPLTARYAGDIAHFLKAFSNGTEENAEAIASKIAEQFAGITSTVTIGGKKSFGLDLKKELKKCVLAAYHRGDSDEAILQSVWDLVSRDLDKEAVDLDRRAAPLRLDSNVAGLNKSKRKKNEEKRALFKKTLNRALQGFGDEERYALRHFNRSDLEALQALLSQGGRKAEGVSRNLYNTIQSFSCQNLNYQAEKFAPKEINALACFLKKQKKEDLREKLLNDFSARTVTLDLLPDDFKLEAEGDSTAAINETTNISETMVTKINAYWEGAGFNKEDCRLRVRSKEGFESLFPESKIADIEKSIEILKK